MNLTALFNDPPPSYAFEISEAGIASADIAKAPHTSFHALSSGTISVSPLRDNLLMPDELAAAVRGIAPVNGNRKRRDAALILPDNCARIRARFRQLPPRSGGTAFAASDEPTVFTAVPLGLRVQL